MKIRKLRFITLLFIIISGSVFAQPTVLGTHLANGDYIKYDLLTRGGGVRFVRLQATSGAVAGARNWEFATGTAGSTNYTSNWRPYTSGQQLSAYNTYVDPGVATGSARYNTVSGGQSGTLPAVVSGSYYTVIVGGNSAANNFMSVLSTTYNPTSVSSVTQSPTTTAAAGQTVTVTVNMAASLNAVEFVYLRYSNDAFATSTILPVTMSGATGTVVIPSSANTSGATVSYYVFTSNQSSAPSTTQADYFSLNIFNSSGQNISGGGTNFSYTVTTVTSNVAPLGNSPYTQNFDNIGNGIPLSNSSGSLFNWNCINTATSTTLGTGGTFRTAATSWGTTNGQFNNAASANSPSTSADLPAIQNARTDRAFAIRQLNTYANPGASFSFQIPNTTGLNSFNLAFKLMQLDPGAAGKTATWNLQYGFGSSPTTWTSATTSPATLTTTTGTWNSQNVTVNFGSALNNNAGPVWIRVVNLSSNTGSNNNPVTAIDDLSLSWSLNSPPTITSYSVAAPGSGSGSTWSGYVGNVVTVNGTNFQSSGMTVKVGGSGGTTVSSYTFVNSTQITFTAPNTSGAIYVDNGAAPAASFGTYTNLGFITTTTGTWQTAGTWLGGAVPPSNTTTDVTIAHNVTGTTGTNTTRNLTVNGSVTLTNTGGATIDVNGASTNSGTITNNGTFSVTGITYTNSGAFTVGIGGTLQINQGGFFTGTAPAYNSTASSLTFNNSSGQYIVQTSHVYWPSSNGPVTVNVNGAGGVQLQTSVVRTVTNLNLSAGFDIQSANLLTVTGNLTINTNGGISSNPPIYGSSSFLIYNTTSNPYGVNTEWNGNGTTAGAGIPQNVTIQNSNNVTMPTTGNRGLAGNLLIQGTASLTLGTTSGDLFVAGNFTNNSNFIHSNRALFLNGATQTLAGSNINGNGASNCFPFLLLQNGTNVTLAASAAVTNILTITSGKITLSTFDLNMGASSISGASSTSYVVTNSTGQLKRIVTSSAVSFPVGNSVYNPITFTNSGTSDTYGIRVVDGNPANAADATKTVLRSWYITEANAGGSDLTPVVAQYNSGEEGGSYNAGTVPYMGLYNGTAWSQVATTLAGANPFTATSTGTNQFPGTIPNGSYIAIGKDTGLSAPAPIISSFSPASGYTGTLVTINGSNFIGATAVTIAGVAATNINVVNDSQITCNVGQGGTLVNNTISVTRSNVGTSSTSFNYLGYITQTGATDWANGASWLGGIVPPTSATTTIANDLNIITAIATPPLTITVNSGKILTVNNAAGSITASTSVTNNGVVTFGAAGSLTTSTFVNSATGTLSWSVAGTLNISAAGTLTNNGTVTATTGTVNFVGAGTVNGSNAITFNNATINTGAVKFPTGTTVNGTFRINGGNVDNTGAAPIYTSNSTLQYAATYTRFFEWSATGIGTIGTTPGYPNNVLVSNSATFTLLNADAGTARAMAGNLTTDTGATFTTGAINAILTVGGNITTTGTGSVTMGATNARINVAGTVTNAGSLTLSTIGGGDLYVAGNLTNNGTFTHNTRAVFFTGSTQSVSGTFSSTGGTTNGFAFVRINNGTNVTLGASAYVASDITFNSGKITLSTFDLTLASAATITSPTSSNYIVTNSTGQLKQVITTTAKNFPVGNSSYNPISLRNEGTSDTYGIRVVDAAPPAAATPAKAVNRYWAVTEAVSGNSNLTPVVLQYNTGEEGGSYNAGTAPYMGLYNGTSWTQVATTLAGANPITATSTGTNQFPASIPSTSYLAIGKDDAFGIGLNDYYRSVATGNWSATSTWQSSPDNINWFSATSIPGSGTGNGFVTVRSGHTVTVDYIASPATLTIAAGGVVIGSDDTKQLYIGSTGTGALNISGTLILDNTIVTYNPIGWLYCGTMTIASGGVFNNNCGNAFAPYISAINVQNGGTYNHNAVGSSVNGSATDFAGGATTRTFGATSNCNITKWGQPSGTSYTALPVTAFGNLTINLNHTSSGSWNQTGSITSIQGNLTVQATGGYQFRFTGNTPFNLSIGGSINITGGSIAITSGTATPTVSVAGGFTQSSGVFDMGGTNSTLIFTAGGVGGNIDLSGGTSSFTNMQVQIGRTCNILNTSNIVIPTSRTFTLNGSCNIASGAKISGAGSFTIANAATATLGIASPDGITTVGTALGNIQTTAARTFQTANYVYNGSANQVTGSGLPINVNTLSISNTGTSGNNIVTFSTSATSVNSGVNPALVLNSGLLNIGTGRNIDIANGGFVSNTGTGDFATTVPSSSGTITFKGAGTVTGTVNFYPGVIQAPSSLLGVNYGTASTIQNFLRLDVNSFVDSNSPKYGNASTLIYNTTGAFNRGLEWTSDVTGTIGTTAGYPNNVQISNTTTLNYYNASNTGPKGMNGNFVIDVGSSITFGGTTTGGALSVLGNVTNAGTITLGAVILDDLKLRGNYANTGTGTFNGNNRAIWFINPAAVTQTVSSVTALTIPFVVTSGAGITVQLLSDVVISSSSTGTNVITFGSASDIIDINGKNLTIGANGNPGSILGTGTFKGSSTSNLTLLGTGSVGTLSFTSGFQNLGTFTMNRTAATLGCVMGTPVTINSSLVLTNGLIDLAATTITLESGVNPTGSANSYIIADVNAAEVGGKVKKKVSLGSHSFPIGDSTSSANGTEYSPATVNFTSGTFDATSYLTMGVNDAKESNLTLIAATEWLTRYWSLSTAGTFTTPVYDFTATYTNSTNDVSGTFPIVSPSFKSNQWDGTNWTDLGNAIGGGTLTKAGCTTVTAVNHITASIRDQEIDVRGNGNIILSGATTTSGINKTAFGLQPLSGPFVINTFTIFNRGGQDLNLTGTPIIQISGSSDFAITATPVTPVIKESSTTFAITFTPTTAGYKTAIITINNNDSNENPYTFVVDGTGDCSSTNTITPTSGPVGTEITVTATSVYNLASATAIFNGLSGAVTQIDATNISVIVPVGAVSGVLKTTNSLGCTAANYFTVIDNAITSCQGTGTIRNSIFISEVTDHESGSHSYVELYNATGASVDISGYEVKVYYNGGSTISTITIPASTNLANNTAYFIGFGGANKDDLNASTAANLTSGISGINSNDNIRLFNGSGIYIDQWGDTSGVAFTVASKDYTYRRKNTGIIAPSTTWHSADWTSFSPVNYSEVGFYNFSSGVLPVITAHPTYTPTCKATSLTIAGTEGFVGGNALTYQWFVSAANATGWTEISSTTDGSIYTNFNTATLNISNISGILNSQFYCQIRENTNTCYSASNAVKIISGQTSTWQPGNTWSNGSPTLDKAVIINNNYDTSVSGSFESCSVTVNNGFTLDVKAGTFVSINNDLTVNTGASLLVQNNGSLVMIKDNGVVTNNGTTQVSRTTTPYERFDYTYWSSPVNNANITSTFTGWRTDYSFDYVTPNFYDTRTINSTVGNEFGADTFDDVAPWAWQSFTGAMTNGKGYAIMAPTSGSFPTTNTVTFSGRVNNGIITPKIFETANIDAGYVGINNPDDDYNLVGNPYPSAISADKFITANGPSIFSGTLYFWTHVGDISVSNPGPGLYNFTSDDYALYNLSGGTGTRGSLTGGTVIPSGFIASGQGFFVEAQANNVDLIFNNDMRIKTPNLGVYHDNSNFFRISNSSSEKDRIWLNLQNSVGMFSQQLIAYFEETTLDYDWAYDGRVNQSNNYVSFYSIAGLEKYKIQARPTFDISDIVPLGYSSAVSGEFSMSIDNKEGIFNVETTPIYLEDLELQIIHDLRASPYTFTTNSGIFENRFLLRYTSALSNPNFETLNNSVVVANNDGKIIIKSSNESIQDITVYDILGRLLLDARVISKTEFMTSNISNRKQAVVVKIKLDNGVIVTRKILL